MKLIFEKSRSGRKCTTPPASGVDTKFSLPEKFHRKQPARLPEVAEVDLVRHYMGLSRRAYGVDNLFYPLGSCTMKYNPAVNEEIAALPGFSDIHPLQPEETAQGCLQVMYDLERMLCEITGMDACSLQCAAGAQGEWLGLNLIKAYHQDRGNSERTNIIVPDSAHGTNPASASMAGFNVINIASNPDGTVNLDALRQAADRQTAALMLTNPNTLGLFEKDITEISKIVHDAGGLLYYDGANLNAVMGICRPGDMGFDVIHLNLHKTFSTPHGGGGPGSGPVGVKSFLADFLPVPIVQKNDHSYGLNFDRPKSIGKTKNFYGNFLVFLKAYSYIYALGGKGLREASENAVLNANYMLRALEKYSDLKYAAPCMHEFVLSLETLKNKTGVTAADVAKALMDRGIHPPTMYFPLIVHEALMVEPTETESIDTLSEAIHAFEEIFEKAYSDPDSLKAAPVAMQVRRVDEVQAARKPVLRAEL
ncbi:MAG: aminomethyl-transferring glycine dehydrogenase subunit GcvPB [Christensenellaceae bacterium]|jgi:glycine dehydrogenase subunit 2